MLRALKFTLWSEIIWVFDGTTTLGRTNRLANWSLELTLRIKVIFMSYDVGAFAPSDVVIITTTNIDELTLNFKIIFSAHNIHAFHSCCFHSSLGEASKVPSGLRLSFGFFWTGRSTRFGVKSSFGRPSKSPSGCKLSSWRIGLRLSPGPTGDLTGLSNSPSGRFLTTGLSAGLNSSCSGRSKSPSGFRLSECFIGFLRSPGPKVTFWLQVVLRLFNNRSFSGSKFIMFRPLKVTFRFQIIGMFNRRPTLTRPNRFLLRSLEVSFRFQIILGLFNNWSLSWSKLFMFWSLKFTFRSQVVSMFYRTYRFLLRTIKFSFRLEIIYRLLNIRTISFFGCFFFGSPDEVSFGFQIISMLYRSSSFTRTNWFVFWSLELAFRPEIIFWTLNFRSLSSFWSVIILWMPFECSFESQIVLMSYYISTFTTDDFKIISGSCISKLAFHPQVILVLGDFNSFTMYIINVVVSRSVYLEIALWRQIVLRFHNNWSLSRSELFMFWAFELALRFQIVSVFYRTNRLANWSFKITFRFQIILRFLNNWPFSRSKLFMFRPLKFTFRFQIVSMLNWRSTFTWTNRLLNNWPFSWSEFFMLRPLKFTFRFQIISMFYRRSSFSRTNRFLIRTFKVTFWFKIIFRSFNICSFTFLRCFFLGSPDEVSFGFQIISMLYRSSSFTRTYRFVFWSLELAFRPKIIFWTLNFRSFSSFWSVVILGTTFECSLGSQIVLMSYNISTFSTDHFEIISSSRVSKLSFHPQIIFVLSNLYTFTMNKAYIIISRSVSLHITFGH
ncbi:Protein of unknown function [Cotesia congregata]|uniref:Uncharacterized protein n=1 Tax=Cotesia congregata TaxID=51543 RepID=A0A8J2HKN3_COTCN|nr:Protein of unknown function [Cotesia congregata]